MTTADTEYTKPLPNPRDENSKHFWDSVHAHKMELQKCPSCGYVRYPHANFCPECLEENNEWVPVSGKATIWSFGIYYHIFNRSFAPDIPYNIALVELEEGPMLYSSVIGIDNDDLKVGMPVEIAYDDVTPEVTLHRFRPRS